MVSPLSVPWQQKGMAWGGSGLPRDRLAEGVVARVAGDRGRPARRRGPTRTSSPSRCRTRPVRVRRHEDLERPSGGPRDDSGSQRRVAAARDGERRPACGPVHADARAAGVVGVGQRRRSGLRRGHAAGPAARVHEQVEHDPGQVPGLVGPGDVARFVLHPQLAGGDADALGQRPRGTERRHAETVPVHSRHRVVQFADQLHERVVADPAVLRERRATRTAGGRARTGSDRLPAEPGSRYRSPAARRDRCRRQAAPRGRRTAGRPRASRRRWRRSPRRRRSACHPGPRVELVDHRVPRRQDAVQAASRTTACAARVELRDAHPLLLHPGVVAEVEDARRGPRRRARAGGRWPRRAGADRTPRPRARRRSPPGTASPAPSRARCRTSRRRRWRRSARCRRGRGRSTSRS